MLVVADASPLNILVRIGYIEVLPRLFGSVVIPPAVATELTHPRTPAEVRTWVASHPPWLQVRRPSGVDPGLDLDPGEAEAIALAVELSADLLLVDDRRARRAADAIGIPKTGTIGVLERAAMREGTDLREAFRRLKDTDFAVSDAILQEVLARHEARRHRPI